MRALPRSPAPDPDRIQRIQEFFAADPSVEHAADLTIEPRLQAKHGLPDARVKGIELLVGLTDWTTGELVGAGEILKALASSPRELLAARRHMTYRMLMSAPRCASYVAAALGSHECPINVNVFPHLVGEQGLVDTVRSVLQVSGLKPHRLTLEIMEHFRLKTLDPLQPLIDDGVRIALDDGCCKECGGMEEMENRAHEVILPGFTEVKLDQDIAGHPRLSHVIHRLLSSFDIHVTIEGVETKGRLQTLQRELADVGDRVSVQGYVHGAMQRLPDFMASLRKGKRSGV